MNHAIQRLVTVFDYLKDDFGDTNQNLGEIVSIMNSLVETVKCKGMYLTTSKSTDLYYGILVYPHISLNTILNEQFPNPDMTCGISRDEKDPAEYYSIDIQQSYLAYFTAEELVATLIHNWAHNAITSTYVERIKLALISALDEYDTKNYIDAYRNSWSDLSIPMRIDIANRTYKSIVNEGNIVYEADRLLVQYDLDEAWNSAFTKIIEINDSYSCNDDKAVNRYDRQQALMLYTVMKDQFESDKYRDSPISISSELYTSMIKYLKTSTSSMLVEDLIKNIRCNAYMKITNKVTFLSPTLLTESQKEVKIILESSTGAMNKIARDIDELSFMMEEVTSMSDKIYILHKLYSKKSELDKKLEEDPKNSIVIQYIKEINQLIKKLKDTKISKTKFGVFIEYPKGYED
jgi:hypothetical protein